MDTSQLPFLLRLADDASENVRLKVRAKLREFGSELRPEISRANLELSPEQARLVAEIALECEVDASLRDADTLATLAPPQFSLSERWLRAQWQGWIYLGDETLKLETALCLLSAWQLKTDSAPALSAQLDGLAAVFRVTHKTCNARELAAWLFGDRGLHGAPPDDYYNPRNSNLVEVIESGCGLPISLTIVFMLVGARLGLSIEGCPFPGHFLARAQTSRGELFFDCYNGGRVLSASEARGVRLATLQTEVVATAEQIVARVLRNLAVAYEYGGETEHAALALQLLRDLEPGSD